MNKLRGLDKLKWGTVRSMYVIYFVKTTIEMIIRSGVEYTEEEK